MGEKEILATLYKNVYGTDKAKEIKESFAGELVKVKSSLDAFRLYKKYETFVTLGRALGTIKNIVNDMRNIIKKSNSKHETALLEAFSLSEGYYYAVNRSSEKIIEERKENGSIELNLNDIEKKIDELYEKGMDTNISFWRKGLGSRQSKESIRAYYLSAFLALSTGRRLTEILKSIELTKYKNEIRVKGILKKGEALLNDTFKIIPLADPDKIVKAWRELRKLLDCTTITNREVNNKYNAIFNKFLGDNIMENVTFHDLRAIYGEACYSKYGDDEVGKRDFIESALLHETTIRAVDYYLNRVNIKKE